MKPCSGTAAARVRSTCSGTGTSRSAGPVTAAAYEPGSDSHATRSPTLTSVTPSPTSRTMPAPSLPATAGNGTG